LGQTDSDATRAWLTNHDSFAQPFTGEGNTNRRKMLLERAFLITPQFMIHIKNRLQPIQTTRPIQIGLASASRSSHDDEPIVNDAGKHSVNEGVWRVTVSKYEQAYEQAAGQPARRVIPS
jgi:hypothetical protein